MSENASCTDTSKAVTTFTYLSGYQAPLMLPFIPWFVVPLANFKGVRFITKIGVSASRLSFVNSTTGVWSAPSFTNADYSDKYTYVDAFSASFSLHDFVSFCIMTAYSTPTSPLLSSAILWIGTETIRLATCVPCGVHWTLIRRIFQSTAIG